MATFRKLGYLGSLVLLGCCLFSAAQDLSTTSSPFYEEPFLVCGEQSLEYSIPPLLNGNISGKLLVQDHEGKWQPLANDASCGIWITLESDGLLIIDADYDGCYITKLDHYYTMTILLEHNSTGEWEAYQKEELRCPIFQVMDSPNHSKCSDVQRVNRLPCAGPSTSQDLCQQRGCCYDPSDSNTPCYYGDQVTAQCTMDGRLSVAISKDNTMPPLILSSVRFPRGSGAGCSAVTQNDAFVLFQFPLSACGTTRKEDGDHIIYENYLVADKDVRTWRGASITRDSTFRLHIRCSFIASGFVPLEVEVFTLPPPPPASSYGPLILEMRIAKDLQYGQYYTEGDYPVVKLLREPVFVEVRILRRSDPALILILDECWATTSENSLQRPQWPILVDRCPFSGDNYITQLASVRGLSGIETPSHYKRFIVNTFTFVDSISQQALGGLVYFHCSASVCIPSSLQSCVTSCRSSRRRRTVDKWNSEGSLTLVTAEGPVEFHLDKHENILIQQGIHASFSVRMEWLFVAVAILGGSAVGIIICGLCIHRSKEKIPNVKP
ncbi:hypothetical protein FKM82_008246 [Ascaphus truei]